MRIQPVRARKGAIVPMTAVCMVALLGFLALSIDLGILMIARNQCQSAADAAAMAGARTLTGDTSTNNNYSNVKPNATAAAAANSILNTPINTSTQLTVTIGDYYYNTTNSAFTISPSSLGYTGDNWTLVQATVTSTQLTYFAKAFGPSSSSIGAMATAVHRPRDIAIVRLDAIREFARGPVFRKSHDLDESEYGLSGIRTLRYQCITVDLQ
jgi:Flp pilus assembly protein TadG